MTWPADGSTNWNQAMKAHVDVAHNDDGSIKKSRALIDLGWLPTSYTGIASGDGTDNQASITLPNGLIVKFGQVTTAGSIPSYGDEGTVEFHEAFSNACELVLYNTGNTYNDGSTVNNVVTELNTDYFKYKHGSNPEPDVIYWIAIGY